MGLSATAVARPPGLARLTRLQRGSVLIGGLPLGGKLPAKVAKVAEVEDGSRPWGEVRQRRRPQLRQM